MSEMEFRPLGDRIVVKRVEAEETTPSGIYIPDTAKEKTMEGVVVAVGPGAWNEDGKRNEIHVEEGDRVVFGKWSGTDVEFDDQDYVIITEDNIIGVLV